MKTIFNNSEKKILGLSSTNNNCSICFLRAKNYLSKHKLNIIKFRILSAVKRYDIEKSNYQNLSIGEIKNIEVDGICRRARKFRNNKILHWY